MKIIVLGNQARALSNFWSVLIRRMRQGGHEVLCCAPPGDPEADAALKGLGAPGPDQALEERLHNLSLMNKSVSARLDALESRLDTLEPHFNQQVDKAAAAAAARILREEIAKLVQG